jgi:3-methyladenine DNA glycosylase AlkD
MPRTEAIIAELKIKAKPDQLAGMARYGMAIEQRLGVSVLEMRQMAKEEGKDE